MFDYTCNQMNNWRWDNPRTFIDQVDRSNLHSTSSAKVKRTGKNFSSYGSHDLRAKIEPPCWQQYKPGDFLAVRPLKLDEVLDEYDDDEIWVDPRLPSGGRSCPGDSNDNDDGKGEDDTEGGEKGTGKRKGAKGGKGKRMATEDKNGMGKATEEGKGNGKGNGNGKWKGIVKQTLGGKCSQSGWKATGSIGNGTWRAK